MHLRNIWVGTLGGLSRITNGQFTSYRVQDGLASNTVLAICEDHEGVLWIGTEDGGLTRLKDGRFSTLTTRDGLANNLVRSVLETSDGSLWIATRDGLSRLKAGAFTTYRTSRGLIGNSVFALHEDREGNLWVGTNEGLSRLTNDSITSYNAKQGLSSNAIAAIYEDREGNLWIGTYDAGLNRLKDGRFAVYGAADGLADDVVRPVLQDRAGALWIGTNSGLSRFRDGIFTTFSTKNGLANNMILSLYEARDGSLWVGTNGGLSRLRDGKFTSYTSKAGLSDNTVLSICEDSSGSLWIGTASGLNEYRDGKFTAYTTADGLSNDSVWSLASDREGNLWIGTDGGGLNLRRNGRFSAYTINDGLANNAVLSLYEDPKDGLWIGTGGGLSRLRDGTFSKYMAAQGLFDDVVFQILEDGAGNLWLSCNKGISRVSKTDLEDFAAGKIQAITSISYGTSDGLKSRECNGGFQPAGCRTADGRLWFPTVKGLALIDPSRMKTNLQAPPVIVERVLVDNVALDLSSPVRLSPGKEKFEFHYTGLSFLAPEKVRFKYKLEGFDRDWVDAGGRRETLYTNIPPGNYTFRVIASNNDGIWNETGSSFEFDLEPRFYQTYWFYGLVALAVAMMGWGLYRLRLRQVQASFAAVLAERNRLAREIHDTLAQGFTGISVQLESVAEMMGDSSAEARIHLDRARSLARSSLAEARRSVWNLRSQALENCDLPAALSNIARQLTTGTNVEALLEVHGASHPLADVVENNLLLIAREALANAIKHARPNRVLIELSYDQQRLRLQVEDDGCGFDIAAAAGSANGRGFGLISMRERADQIKGGLIVDSEQGRGTKVSVTVPC